MPAAVSPQDALRGGTGTTLPHCPYGGSAA
ncbi:MAG: hypothetical protein JWQ45_2178 [Blastococcus sp.]|nr:hypothetical protein [Blastococcus sp.]